MSFVLTPRSQNTEPNDKDRLLKQYFTKQAQLQEYEKLCQIKRLEMMEISKQIEDLKIMELKLHGKQQDIYKHAFVQTEKEINQQPISFIEGVKRKASIINNQTLYKKASTIFERKFDAFTDIFKKDDSEVDLHSSFNIDYECSLEYDSEFET